MCRILLGGAYLVSLLGLGALLLWPTWPGFATASVLIALAATLIVALAPCPQGESYTVLILASFLFLIGFPVNGLARACDLEGSNPLLPADLERLSLGLVIGSLGWLSMTLGFVCHARSGRPNSSISLSPPVFPASLLAFLLSVGVIGCIGRFVVGSFIHSAEGANLFGSVGMLFAIITFFGGVAMLCLYTDARLTSKTTAVLFVGIYSGIGVLTGQRFEIFRWIFSFLLFLLLRNRLTGRPLRRLLAMFCVLSLGFIAAYPMLTDYKDSMSSIRRDTSGLARVRGITAMTVPTVSSIREPFRTRLGKVLSRMSHLQYTALLATDGHRAWGWLKGASLGNSLITFIPRFVWHEKPVVGLGQRAYELMGYKAGTGSSTVPLSVDWYLNFSWPGVILGMLAAGLLLSAVNQYLSANDVFLNATFACLLLDLAYLGQGIAGLVSSVGLFVGGTWLLHRFVWRPLSGANQRTRVEVQDLGRGSRRRSYHNA